MAKEIRRTVDDYLPKWLHSRFLSAVHYIWEVKGDHEESIKRVDEVWDSGLFSKEEMSWIMMLLTIPRLQTIIESSDEFNSFRKKATIQ